jgi:hypothetical protein
MKRLLLTAVAAALLGATPSHAAAPATDVVSRMFTWWNGALKRPDGFTERAFARYYTPDATLTLNGETQVRGLAQWVEHFRKIQASGHEVEIVVPFKDVFQVGNHVFTYHVIRSRGGGHVGCMLAAGEAVLRGGKIASMTLVRAPLDPAGIAAERDCWKQ